MTPSGARCIRFDTSGGYTRYTTFQRGTIIYRAIVRFSLNGSNGAQIRLRQVIRPLLEAAGFVKTPSRTSTYEMESANLADLTGPISQVYNLFPPTAPSEATLDHVWTYIDQCADDEM